MSDFLLVELRDDDVFEAEAEGHMQAGDDAVGGEHRDDVQKALVSRVGDAAVFERGGNCIEAVMAQHDTLRHAGRAAGQRDRCTVVFTVAGRVGGLRIGTAVLRERVPGHDVAFFFDLRSRHLELLDEFEGFRQRRVGRDDDDVLEAHLLKIVFQFVIEEVDQQEDLRVGPLDELIHLLGGQTGVEGHQRRAKLVEPVKGVDRFRERDGRACDDIALFHAKIGKGGRSIVGTVDQFTIGDLPVEVVDGYIVFKALVTADDRLIDGLFGNFCLLCGFTEELHPGLLLRGETFDSFHCAHSHTCFPFSFHFYRDSLYFILNTNRTNNSHSVCYGPNISVHS